MRKKFYVTATLEAYRALYGQEEGGLYDWFDDKEAIIEAENELDALVKMAESIYRCKVEEHELMVLDGSKVIECVKLVDKSGAELSDEEWKQWKLGKRIGWNAHVFMRVGTITFKNPNKVKSLENLERY